MNLVFLHGWGLNSAIWSPFIDQLIKRRPDVSIHLLDLPGYGRLADKIMPESLSELAQSVINRAPDSAIWVGWSLGGMVALQAALEQAETRISGLQLIGTCACFVQKEDWPHGVDAAVFQKFADELSNDYKQALSMFLILQSGANKGARALAKYAHGQICEFPDPSPSTLQAGINCLAKSDLRQALQQNWSANMPVQIVNGLLDRVANPEGVSALAQTLSADLLTLKTGHAPFLTNPEEVLSGLESLIAKVEHVGG